MQYKGLRKEERREEIEELECEVREKKITDLDEKNSKE